MDNNTLIHWGIKGMRWGVRRYQNPDGSLTPAGKKRQVKIEANTQGDDYKKARAKSVKQMSDSELRSSINRLQMEQQYAQLTAKKKSAGRKWVESLLTDSSKDIAKKYIDQYGKMGVDAAINYGVKVAKSKSANEKLKWVL